MTVSAERRGAYVSLLGSKGLMSLALVTFNLITFGWVISNPKTSTVDVAGTRLKFEVMQCNELTLCIRIVAFVAC